jgi:NADPH2:quinone reductase
VSRAGLLRAFGAQPQPEDRPVPERGSGTTLVRVRAAQVSHIDLDVLSGSFGVLPDLPCVPGTEAAGHVVSSDRHPVGALVRVRGGGVGLRRDGGWAEHLLAPDSAVFPVPEGVDPALACTFFSPACTGHAVVHDVAAVQRGERVLVTGAAGAVGAVVVQLAVRAGADVVGAVGSPSKLAELDGLRGVVTDQVTPEGVGGPVDVLVDTVGGEVLQRALALVRPGGRAALLGYTAGRRLPLELPAFLLADVALLPVNLLRRGSELTAVADRLLRQVQDGTLRLPVTAYPEAGLLEAVERLRGRSLVGKVAVTFR